jgi:hypothetical protein
MCKPPDLGANRLSTTTAGRGNPKASGVLLRPRRARCRYSRNPSCPSTKNSGALLAKPGPADPGGAEREAWKPCEDRSVEKLFARTTATFCRNVRGCIPHKRMGPRSQSPKSSGNGPRSVLERSQGVYTFSENHLFPEMISGSYKCLFHGLRPVGHFEKAAIQKFSCQEYRVSRML